jgi:hypothetical protein
MVALVVLLPQLVMHYKGTGVQIDPAAVQKKLDELIVPGLDSPLPGLDGPSGGPPPGLPGLEPPPPPKIE